MNTRHLILASAYLTVRAGAFEWHGPTRRVLPKCAMMERNVLWRPLSTGRDNMDVLKVKLGKEERSQLRAALART